MFAKIIQKNLKTRIGLYLDIFKIIGGSLRIGGCFCDFDPKFWEVEGPTNGRSISSFYECKFSAGDTMKCGDTKPYHIQKNLFELFALTGGEDTKDFGHKFSHAQEPPLWKFHNISSQ